MNKNIFTKLMFKRTILLVILTVLVSLSHSFVVTTYAYSNIPVEVRIGLFLMIRRRDNILQFQVLWLMPTEDLALDVLPMGS